jgi:hypothetical protein
MAEPAPRRDPNPSVCPYCGERFGTQPELVEHLTVGDGCPKRTAGKHRRPSKSAGWQKPLRWRASP